MDVYVRKGESKALPCPCHGLCSSLFSASWRFHNNVNYSFIQDDTTCTDGHFLQPEQDSGSCARLQGSGGNPIPPTPADPAVLPREHFQLKQRLSQGQNEGLGRLMVSFVVANPLKSTDKSGT